jgi:viroplasmin and RNaseH domain-containing protein
VGSEDKDKYWVVFIGHKPGIYTSWAGAKLQVNGYPGNLLKKYNTLDEAEEALLAFHEDRYRLIQDMELAQSKHQSSNGASTSSTSTNALECQHRTSLWTYFVVIFLLGFVCAIVLAHLFDSE